MIPRLDVFLLRLAGPLFFVVTLCMFFTGCGKREETAPGEAQALRPTEAQSDISPLRVDGTQLVSAQGRPVNLRGVNTDGWLDLSAGMLPPGWLDDVDPRLDAWSMVALRIGHEQTDALARDHVEQFFTEADLTRLAATGMNAVRVPVAWSMTRTPATARARLDQARDWCREHGMYLVIALRGPSMEMTRDTTGANRPGRIWEQPEHLALALSFWTDLAEHYRGDPVIAAFDLLDEPEPVPPWQLILLYDELVNAVASVDPSRILALADGGHGLDALPRPASRSWSNIVYMLRGESPLLQHRAALDLDTPAWAGAVRVAANSPNHSDLLLREIDLINASGWSWFFTPYKMFTDDLSSLTAWTGLVPGLPAAPGGDGPSFDTAWRELLHANPVDHPLLPAALSWRAPEPDDQPDTPAGRVRQSVESIRAFPAHPNQLRRARRFGRICLTQWGRADAAVWTVDSEQGGYRRLGVTARWPQEPLALQVWVNGVLVIQRDRLTSSTPNTFTDLELGSVVLDPGRNIIEWRLIHGDGTDLALAGAWHEPSDSVEPPLESALWLKPTSWREDLTQQRPFSITWTHEQPGFAHVPSEHPIAWTFKLREGGTFRVMTSYSTINLMTRFEIASGEQTLLASFIPTSGATHRFLNQEVGLLELPPGEHTLRISLTSTNQNHAGSLRDVRFQRVTGMNDPR